MGDAAADVESEIGNVLEMFFPEIFIYFLALKTVKWNLGLINPYILRITCDILYPSNDNVYGKEPQCFLPIPWPFAILTEFNPKFGFNQGDIKQDTAIQELENLQSNLLGKMSILINYFWSCLKAVSCTIQAWLTQCLRILLFSD